jgi:AraC family transcriptional regulator
MIRQSFDTEKETERQKLQFEVKFLDDFEFLCLEYRGIYDDFLAIKRTWKQLLDYALEKGTLTENSIFMTEIQDDNEISDSLSFRYNLGVVLDKPLSFRPEGLFKSKVHKRQKYARFIHKGPYEKSIDTYNKIYAFWMVEVNLELVDLPTIEIYLNNDENTPKEELLIEIYIPVK